MLIGTSAVEQRELTDRAVIILLVHSISLRSKFFSRQDMSMTI